MRINQAKIQRLYAALQQVIASVHDARTRYQGLADLRPTRLCGFAKFLKDAKGLPHGTDMTALEAQFKRRLVRAQHRIFGLKSGEGSSVEFSLAGRLPVPYQEVLQRYKEESERLLRVLADVDIQNSHQPLLPVSTLISSAPSA